MRHKRRPRRAALGLAALVVGLGGAGDGSVLHECPHHEAAPSRQPGQVGHAEHASPASHGSVPDGPCRCIGACHASAASQLPQEGAAVAPRFAGAARLTLSAIEPTTLHRRRFTPHFHAYANPPPLSG